VKYEAIDNSLIFKEMCETFTLCLIAPNAFHSNPAGKVFGAILAGLRSCGERANAIASFPLKNARNPTREPMPIPSSDVEKYHPSIVKDAETQKPKNTIPIIPNPSRLSGCAENATTSFIVRKPRNSSFNLSIT
jgi:hypothetical protein